jgi:hypothetical protein
MSMYTYNHYTYNILPGEFIIDNNLIKNIIIYSKNMLYSITANTDYKLGSEEIKHLILPTYIDFSKKFKFINCIHLKYASPNVLMYKKIDMTSLKLKYIKYKTKYLKLKK